MADPMPQYLFLYPTKFYFDSMMSLCRGFKECGYSARRINDIIDARYRDNGYGISWLVFSKMGNACEPDLSCVSPYVKIRDGDLLLCTGYAFIDHMIKHIYPDANRLLDNLPPHKRLVLGGFHRDDCIERVARASWMLGVDTFVDEDTTNSFFPRTCMLGELPLVRESWGPYSAEPPDLLESEIERRKGRPWLVQG